MEALHYIIIVSLGTIFLLIIWSQYHKLQLYDKAESCIRTLAKQLPDASHNCNRVVPMMVNPIFFSPPVPTLSFTRDNLQVQLCFDVNRNTHTSSQPKQQYEYRTRLSIDISSSLEDFSFQREFQLVDTESRLLGMASKTMNIYDFFGEKYPKERQQIDRLFNTKAQKILKRLYLLNQSESLLIHKRDGLLSIEKNDWITDPYIVDIFIRQSFLLLTEMVKTHHAFTQQ